jgi:RecA-family ATPase
VIVVNGTPIDLLNDLDRIAIGKSGKKQAGDGGHAGGNGFNYGDEFVEAEELMRRILSGEALHTSVTSLAGKFARDGQPIAYAIATIRAVFGAAHASGVSRYQGRWPELLEAIQWVYGREARKGDSERAARAEPNSSTETPIAIPYLNTADWDAAPPTPIEYIVADRIPARQVCLFTGHGASGKSTIALNLCCATVLGRDWLKGLPQFGPALFLDGEEDEQALHHRLYANVQHYQTSFAQLRADGLQIAALAGKDMVMATADRSGKVVPTRFYQLVLEQAADLKPKIIVLASLANMFAGEENNRSQAQQFVSLLTRIAIACGGAVIPIAHPSLTGITSKSGISGSTAWFNSVRAQMYLRSIEDKDDEQADTDLRVLEFKKNQYGRLAEVVTLSWRDGLFLPISSASVEQLAREHRVDELLLTLLRRFSEQHRPVAPTPRSPSYAPEQFYKEPEAMAVDAKRKELEAAMRRLLKSGAVLIRNFGSPAKQRPYLVLPERAPEGEPE